VAEKHSFQKEVADLMSLLDGNPIDVCIQCGTCSGSCPAVEYMDHSPRQIIAMIRADLKDQVVNSDTIWCCSSCYNCTVRCPKNIKITEMMYALKRYCIWKHAYRKGVIGPAFSRRFVGIVVKTGKSYEPGLAPTFMLKYGIRGMIDNMTMGMNLLRKRRMALIPKKVKRIENFRRVLNRIIPVGVKE
jgi:heterodisulfide reductase subunit C